MQTTSDGRDDGGYDDPTASSSNRNTRRRRDQTHWAVDLQLFSLRPAGCRSCGHYFLPDEPRMCTWSERTRPRWLHPACLLPEQTAAIETLTPIGTATDQHTTQIKDSWRTPTPALATLLQQEDEDSSKLDWHELRLPNRSWWEELDLQAARPKLRTTFVQIPDRWQGAYSNARGKFLEVHDAAMARGSSTAEWKALLLFDSLLLAHGRTNAACSKELEERLQWFWGGQ